MKVSAPVIALVAASACSSGNTSDGGFYGTVERVGGRDGTTLYLNNHSEPEYLDPNLSSESTGSTLVRNLNEGLVMLHPRDVHPVAGIANRWSKSADNKLFRFHLRPEAKWSDGVPVVAQHFVDSWRRMLDPTTGARMATNMYAIHGGALFHRGRVRVLDRDENLLSLDRRDGPPLAKGTAVVVLKTTPAKAVQAPMAENSAASVTVDVKGKAVSVSILGVGGAVKCNGEDDRWYRVKVGQKEGWLAGCAILDGKGPKSPSKYEQTLALVEEHLRPTYGAAVDVAKPRIGLIDPARLVADSSVIGVRAVNDHELEVELQRSTPYFLELVATTAYFPVRLDVNAKHGDKWTRPETIVTNGPYTLDSHKFRYEITFKPNPHYWDRDKLKIKRVVWLAVEDNFATLNLYKSGEIDWLGENVALPPAFIEMMKQYDDYSIATWTATYWYEFNTQKAPVDDVRVRQALNVTVDKQQLIDKVTHGGQIPAKHIVPPYAGGGYAELFAESDKNGTNPFTGQGYEFDPEHGRALLREAGYTVEKTADGYETKNFPPLEVIFNSSEAHRKIAVALQGMWRTHLGITVQVRNEEWKVMIKTIRDGNFQIARFGWVADYNHPHTWLDTFLSYSNNNWTGWNSPEFDSLLLRAASEGDLDKSIRMYRDAEKLAVDGFSRIPLYFYTKHTMMKPYVKGNWPNASNKHPVKYMWIDPDWRSGGENETAYPVEALPPPEPWVAH